MSNYLKRVELQVDSTLVDFIEQEVLPGLDLGAEQFWQSLSDVVRDLTPENKALLAKRDAIQSQLDDWNKAHQGQFDLSEYKAFLSEIGYLLPEGDDFEITTTGVDDEIARQAGPQL